MPKKRLRIFAGPNGSGKTTLRQELEGEHFSPLYYLNPDDILKNIQTTGFYELHKFERFEDLTKFALASSYKEETKEFFRNGDITCKDGKLYFGGYSLNAHTVSLLVTFRCDILVMHGKSFSLETVFSSEKKLSLLRKAKLCGYKVYLYVIATETPEINRARIEGRVADGGHDVPYQKVAERYPKSLKNIATAVRIVDRAFFWDNSKMDTAFIASYDAKSGIIEIKVPQGETPQWFKTRILGCLMEC